MDRIDNARRSILICVLLAGVTFAAYLPLFQNGFVKYDDREYVLENFHIMSGLTWPNVQWAFQTSYSSNWHPLTWISHMLDVQLFGVKPVGHHLTSLLFHVANALLLFLLFKRMTGAVWRSAFVAAFFALHPLHVESVAWMAERKDVLSAFFGLLCLIAYAKYVEKGEGRRKKEVGRLKSETRNQWAWYGAALVFFALGLMSKPMLVTWPFVMLLLDFWPLRRLRVGDLRGEDADSGNAGENRPQAKQNTEYWKLNNFLPLLWEKIPFFALAAASSVVTFLAQRGGHSVATAKGLPIGVRLANAIVSYFKYLSQTLWPVDLAVFYPHAGILGPRSGLLPDWQIFVAVLVVVAISLAALTGLKRRPWLATGWFWYLGTLVPVIGVIQVGGQAMADRYTYIPLIGFFMAAVWAAADLLGQQRSGRLALAAAGFLAAGGCLFFTQKQVKYWRNDRVLFEHTLAVTGNNPVAHYNLGVDIGEAGDYELAAKHFRAALAYDPSYADAYYSLAYISNLQGKVDEAIEQCRAALRFKPWHALSRNGLGAMLWTQGKRKEAIEEYREAVRYQPDQVTGHYNLGVALAAEGSFSEAAEQFVEVIRLQPENVTARTRLAEMLARDGKPAEAEKQIREVVSLSPTNTSARVHFAGLLRLNGKREEAMTQYAEILRLEPDYAQGHCDWGTLLLEGGKVAEAESHFAAAVKLKADYVEALTGLGRAEALQGKLAEAQTQFREAARLSPTNVEAQINLGNALAVAGQTNEAAGCFASASRLDPSLAQKKAQAGRALLDQGQLEAATASLSVAINLNPTHADAQQDLGLALARLGKPEAALPHFEAALRLRPDAQAYYNLALTQVIRQRPAEAAVNYERALNLKPDWAEALNDLAWLRATSAQADLRNGAEAVRLAEAARKGNGAKEARFQGTLAAAYAEAGRFEDAVKTAENAIALATAAGQKELAEKNRQLLGVYREKKAYREGR